MKRSLFILFFAIAIGFSFLHLTSCTKTNTVTKIDSVTINVIDTVGVILPNMQGTWVGQWGNDFDALSNAYTFNVSANSVFIVNNGSASYTGTWKVTNYTFIGDYSIGGQTLEVRAPIDSTTMQGTWQNITAVGSAQGTFLVTKQ